MKLLLDTHTFIWFINGDERLSKKAIQEIINPQNIKFVSIVTIWEMAIKVSLGKLKINYPFEDILRQIDVNGFEVLPIVFDHTLLVTQLDFHHRDPFDRLLIAQAISDEMIIVGQDDQFFSYGVNLLW